MSAIVREATQADVPQLVEMGLRFLASSEYSGRLASNGGQMASFVSGLIDGDKAAVFVSEKDGTLTGMIGYVMFEHPMSGERIGSELFWWTDSPGAGVALLRRGEEWAVTHGAVKLSMVAPNERVGRFYQKRGYRPVETVFERSV